MPRYLDQHAFVLHTRDYGESSQIVELLTRGRGRLAVLHKGARQARRGALGRLQPFSCYRLGWTGRAQLKTLLTPEIEQQYLLRGRALAAGFYLNELIWHLTGHEDASEVLFDAYRHCLEVMATEIEPLDVGLRRFERVLLDQLGYGLAWEVDAQTGAPIEAERDYYFRFGEGFYPAPPDGEIALPGRLILAMAADDYRLPETRQQAKRLFRRVLDQLLQGRELHSRALLRAGD